MQQDYNIQIQLCLSIIKESAAEELTSHFGRDFTALILIKVVALYNFLGY